MNKQERFEKKFYKMLEENNIDLSETKYNSDIGDINTSVGRLTIGRLESEPRSLSCIFTRFDNPTLAKEKTDCNPFSGKWNFFDSNMDFVLSTFFNNLKIIL